MRYKPAGHGWVMGYRSEVALYDAHLLPKPQAPEKATGGLA